MWADQLWCVKNWNIPPPNWRLFVSAVFSSSGAFACFSELPVFCGGCLSGIVAPMHTPTTIDKIKIFYKNKMKTKFLNLNYARFFVTVWTSLHSTFSVFLQDNNFQSKRTDKLLSIKKGLPMTTVECSAIYITPPSNHLIQLIGGLVQNKIDVVAKEEGKPPVNGKKYQLSCSIVVCVCNSKWDQFFYSSIQRPDN